MSYRTSIGMIPLIKEGDEMRRRPSYSRSAKSSTRIHKLAEQLYQEDDTLNLAAQKLLTGEEQAERERLAHLFSSGKSLSEMIIEDRSPY